MKCFICNKKITWSAKAITKDWKWICPDDINKIVIDANANKWAIHLIVSNWIQGQSSEELKRKIDNHITFTKAELKQEQPKINKENTHVSNTSEYQLVCPHCGSTNIQPLGQHRKGFSIGKAVGGTILTGGVGALAGFAGKKTNQTDFVCMNCGKQFKR